MSWNEVWSIARRLEFVKLALKAQRGLSQLCRKHQISRASAYKWIGRFEEEGKRGLMNRSRRPHRSPEQIGSKWIKRIRRLRRRHRTWGSRKLRARLAREYPGEIVPSARTIGRWLKRLNLSRRVRRRTRRGPQKKLGRLTTAVRSNHVWTVDFKGWFRTRDGMRVDPLTVRDLYSRYVLSVRLLRNQSWRPVRRIFVQLFRQYGAPAIIRADNGSPFGSTGPAGLSCLSAWWTSLGIRVEYIAPGHPEQNGGHEQMHGVLKQETTRPASENMRAQQRRTNRWVSTFNEIRPHQALGNRVPKEVYKPRGQPRRKPVIKYGKGWVVRRVRSNGQIKWQGRKRFVGEALIGYRVGLKAMRGKRWRVNFGPMLIGELWKQDAGGMRPAKYHRPRSM